MVDRVNDALTRAVAAHRAGKAAEAEAGYREVLEVLPEHVEARRLLGTLYLQLRRYAAAAEHVRALLAINPDDVEGLGNLGLALLAQDDIRGAIVAYRRICELKPDHAGSHYNLGYTLQQGGDHAAAVNAFQRAAELAPRLAQAHAGLAVSAHTLGNAAQAEAAFRQALDISPDDAITLNNWAGFLLALGRIDEALSAARKAGDAMPQSAAIQVTLGNCFRRQNAVDDAMSAYHRALTLNPKLTEARVSLGHLLRERGRWSEAADVYERAVGDGWARENLRDISSPSSDHAYYLGLLQLKLGDFGPGWENFESRTFSGEARERTAAKRYLPPPSYWMGEDLTGKHIFVWREQGLGDQILFGSMLPDLIDRAGQVTFDSKTRLTRVFERSFPQAKIIDGGTGLNSVISPEKYDLQIGLGSLGKFLRPSFTSFPRQGRFLHPDPAKTEALRIRYRAHAKDRKIVGVAWRSQNEKLAKAKSADITDWRDVLTVSDAWFVNLQYGPCAQELAAVKATMNVDIFDDSNIDAMGNLDEVFAQVAALDLVISTSNTVVHIAGSLGVPCWLVLPQGKGALWYWFANRSDSPWYSSLRIYRESRRPGDPAGDEPWWREPISQAGTDLRAFTRGN